MRWLILILVAQLLSSGGDWTLGPSAASAEMTTAEKRIVKEINATVVKAASSYAGKDFQAASDHVREAMKQVHAQVPSGTVELYEGLLPAMRRMEKAHVLLELQGVIVAPFERPARPDAMNGRDVARPESADSLPPSPQRVTPKPKPVPPKSVPSPDPTSPDAAKAVSFTKDVAPILSTRCGRCHIRDSKGGFSSASFAALMKGPPEGVVIFAGDTVGSRLIETIETGDMPRGGGRVTKDELRTLKDWILAGARFDGEDPAATIGGGTPPAPTINMNVEVKMATGNETVSFAADVAPLLVDNCNGCHIDAMQTRGGLRMDSFSQFLRGGDTGAIIVPGKGDESLLVQKLKGMVGQRMPAGGRDALSEESIQLISTWIDEGATLDGASATQPLRVMSQLAWAATAGPEELSERRRELAANNVKLVSASPGSIESHDTEHFHVAGPVSIGTLQLVGKIAEEQMKTVRTVIKGGGSGDAFFRGKATIFAFPKRYDYSEFAKMVEQRSVPSDWSGHWSFDGIDAYVSVVASERDEEEAIEARLVAPLVALAVATRGSDVPRWFAEGIGRSTASRVSGSRERDAIRRQAAEMSEAIASMENAKQFIDGKLGPEQTDRIGTALATAMLDRTRRRGFDALIRGLDEGKAFDIAFQESFGTTPQMFVESWIRYVRGG